MPFLLMVLMPLADTLSLIQRFSDSIQNRWDWMFGVQRRFPRRWEWLMVLPNEGLRPVTSQIFDMGDSSFGAHVTARIERVHDAVAGAGTGSEQVSQARADGNNPGILAALRPPSEAEMTPL